MTAQDIAPSTTLPRVTQQAHRTYAKCLTGGAYVPWWTTVIITASSAKQAAGYREEIARRQREGQVPASAQFLVVPDLDNERIGSGGATLNALRVLAETLTIPASTETLTAWWAQQRVLIIHCGGDSRRLPQYSLSGKLFSVLPVQTPWGKVSTVFDEMLALSTPWAARVSSGLVVSSGDVILTFDADTVTWERTGVCGVGMREPIEVGSKHGVYVVGEQGRVYSFLQKPSIAQVQAAGGILDDDLVAVDTGILKFDAAACAQLSTLAGIRHSPEGWLIDYGVLTRTSDGTIPTIDLYEHMTLALTGEWVPKQDADSAWHTLAKALQGIPFWCDVVAGEFTHIGTTKLFRQLLTEETTFSRLYEARQRLGAITYPGLRSAGVIIESALLGGGELAPGSVIIECELHGAVHVGHGAILHGLSGLQAPIDIPDDTVVHQVPLALPDGQRGVVIRTYGVNDDPKGSVAQGTATWFGRPLLDTLAALGLDQEQVWPDTPAEARTLWNAHLFPLCTVEQAWACARWMLGIADTFSATEWAAYTRFSLASSTQRADSAALAEARTQRLFANWTMTALTLAESGSDIRPLLASSPNVTVLATTGRALVARADALANTALTEAATQYFHASRFLGHAGLADEADEAYRRAFAYVQHGVEFGVKQTATPNWSGHWSHNNITVSAPARIDLGGGWSDTPPFCLDWGGTVLNLALTLNGEYPIRTSIKRLSEPVLRCISDDIGESTEYRTTEEVLARPEPGCPFSIPRVLMHLTGLIPAGTDLATTLQALGGGLEIRTSVHLPMGSGLGTSSILAATMVRALAEMLDLNLTDYQLIDQVMCLEQLMTTGGGWQDQVGGIFPGAKVIMSGPGLRQRLRIAPVGWTPEREQEFSERLVLYYTGIRRIAKNLLAQVVGSYLAREVATVQVLHSIKTLATEMSYAMREGEWSYLGDLIDRHWALNQTLDPHTTNAPINALLQEVRPYLAGAKLAGAGGGGFMILLAKDQSAATALRAHLANDDLPGTVYECAIVNSGMRIERDE
ncbi:MAG TPA: bifunctional fucokinase/fucose-1-phosphate guanylyltransferase [Armatimonadota bacterium]|jgi:fucokinase